MSISRLTAVGFLVCLTALYLMNDLWLKDGVLAALPVFGVFLFPIGAVMALAGLFSGIRHKQ